MILKNLLITLFFFPAFTFYLSSQMDEELSGGGQSFYFDAIVFKGSQPDAARVDVYVLVPSQALSFLQSEGKYIAHYSIDINIYDSSGAKYKEELINRRMMQEDYQTAQGSTGSYDYSQTIFFLPDGRYKINVVLTDTYSKKEYSRSRVVTVLNFNEFPFALSGILIVSSIEERQGRYVITPHISDNIGNLSEGFFAFFETYNKSGYDSVDLVYEIMSSDGDIVAKGNRVRKSTRDSVTQQFIRISKPSKIASGTYTLEVIALKTSAPENYNLLDYLAVTQRSIRFAYTLSSIVIADIRTAIKQLRYVASVSELDFIENASDEGEQSRRFEEFWKSKDPTPGTDRNEAFDEYYQRIDYANKNFKSYTEGWLTDMGMVYIIFGQPYNIERSTGYYSEGKIYVRWTYRNNREFIFQDNSGVGDFRLVRPMMITEKYRYGGN